MHMRKALFTALAATLALPAVAQQSSSGEEEMMIDEILVTARRRSESLMDIPMSVSAFSAQDIQQAGYANVLDMIEAVPGVTYGSFEAQAQGDSPSFRGVSNNTGDPTLQNSSKFIDGVYVSGSLYSVMFTDIERVEVVKGPQSALFGRATFSGAINYITKKPTEELTGYVDATVAEFGETRLNGTISGPITDTLGFRLSAGLLNEGSDYDNITDGSEMGDNEIATGSLSLQFTPTEDLSANLYVNYTDAQFGEALRAATPRVNGELAFPLEEVIGANIDQLDEPGIASETIRTNLTVDWNLDNFTFSSITGYGNEESTNEADGDYGPAQPFGFLFFLCTPDSPFAGPNCDLLQTVVDTELENFFQEFRITSSDDQRLRWIAGVSYFEEEYYRNRIRNFRQPESLKTSDNISIFGSLAYDINDQLTATFDARYQEETIELEQAGNNQEGDFDSFLPRFIVEYTPTENSMFYASASKGNKPGDFNDIGTPEQFLVVDEEQLWSYEIGTKFSAPDNRYTAEFAAYLIDWTDQVSTFIDPDPGIGAYSVNAGETEIRGIDLSFVYQFSANLSASIAYSYVDAEFVDFETAANRVPPGASRQIAGNNTARTPKNSAFASLRYDAPVNLFGGSEFFARADVSYRDEQFIDEVNLDFLESQTLVNLRAGIDTGNVRVTLWIDNAFDNDAPTTGFQFAANALVGLPLGRQAGVTAAYTF